MFDVLIIGGGVAGVSCALVLGSAHKNLLHRTKTSVFSPIKEEGTCKMPCSIMYMVSLSAH